MFSPIFAISARRVSSIVWPPSSVRREQRLDDSPDAVASAAFATLAANCWKSFSRATKSVSQLTSTIAARLPSAGALDHDHAFGRDARGLLVGLRETGLAHQLGGGVQIAVGFDERLLALHHARAGALAEHLHCFSGDGHDHSVAPRGRRRRRGGAAAQVCRQPQVPQPRRAAAAAGLRLASAALRRAMNSSGAHVRLDVVDLRRDDLLDRLGLRHLLRRARGAGAFFLRTAAGRPRRGCGRAGLRLRLAFLVELDELVFAGRHFRHAPTGLRAPRRRCLRRTAGSRAWRRRCPEST